ncbi:LPXTG cell wall anchor domain-containing protein [Clostridium sp.]|uniref:LPXTG cell wall anchor domain-containing protein n=1 Tax=Clostridium sp. TaxID=1506 RepID=UPI0039926147
MKKCLTILTEDFQHVDNSGMLHNISTIWISILIFLIGALFLFIKKRKNIKRCEKNIFVKRC